MASRRNLFNASSSDQTRASWSPQNITLFLELLVVEKNVGNWSGKSPTTHGYANIAKTFQENKNITFKKPQLKSKFENLRSLFHLWTNMFNGQTGAGFEIATGRMMMEAEWWDNKIRTNEQYKRFRDDGLENAELMYSVYGDNSATGAYQFTPTARNPRYNNNFSQEDEFVPENETSPPRQAGFQDDEVNSLIRTTQDSGRSRLSGRKRSSSYEDRVELVRREFELASTPSEMTIKHEHHKGEEIAESTRKAMDVLYGMENLDTDLFDVGLAIMEDSGKRNVFLNLRNDADRIRWLSKKAKRG